MSILLTLPFLSESCKSKNDSLPNDEAEATIQDTLPSDFIQFYNRFHEDSTFQIEHIVFPLEGLPPSSGAGDTLNTTRYYWQKADWKKHNHFTDPGQHFEQWYEVTDARLIEHWIHMKGTNLYMQRRFAYLGDEWFLIYYQGLRPMKKE
jgi:hypothetical protein